MERNPLPAPTTPSWVPEDVVTLAVPLFIVLVIVEMIIVRVSKRGAYEAKDSAASLFMGFGSTIAGILTGGLYLVAAYWIYQFRLFDIGWTWWALLLCFLGEDLAYYWFHRIAHERRFWWASHVVHHSSQHYNLTTALRQTWTGNLSLSFATKLPLFLIGFPVEMVLMFTGISLVYQFWVHTETVGRMGAFEWIFNTPSHHRVHHATNPRYLDANYAGVLIIWDRLFGTFIPEVDHDRPRYGIVSNLGTFNPLRIATHEWIGILRDLRGAKSIGEWFGYIFGPPGWTPDGSRKTSKMLKAEWREAQQGGPQRGAGYPEAAISTSRAPHAP
ncbi:MAG: sterol desaturase family protein [Hyphomonadaceae bacterium]|nr:sterol desaturase family protein [Hyphomonadaceae bacterium]